MSSAYYAPIGEETTVILVGLTGTLSHQIADATVIADDLSLVRSFCLALEAMPENVRDHDDDGVIAQALWLAIGIAYRRPFTSGKSYGARQARRRRIPDEWIDDRELHQSLLDHADQHIAHRAEEAAELAQMYALLNAGEPRGVIGVTTRHERFWFPTRAQLVEARQHVESILARFMPEIERGRQRLIVQARSLDLDAAYELAERHRTT